MQKYGTNLGITVWDTLNVFVTGMGCENIARIKIYDYHRFVRSKVGKLLMFGGAGYFVLNIANGAYFNQPVTSNDNLTSLAIALGAFTAGFVIDRYFPVNRFSRKRHKIVYVNMD